MNNYYPNNFYPTDNGGNSNPTYTQNPMYQSRTMSDNQLYLDGIIGLNKGKKAKFYVTIPGSSEWQDKIIEGIIEQTGKDHIIVSNPNNGEWYLILMIYLDIVVFEEPINY